MDIRSSLLRKAEDEFLKGHPRPRVAWDKVQERAVVLLCDCVPDVGLWASMYAHELGMSREPSGASASGMEAVTVARCKRRRIVGGAVPRVNREDPYALGQSHILRKERIGALYNMGQDCVYGLCIVYFVWNAPRVRDNLALYYAQRLASSSNLPLLVICRYTTQASMGLFDHQLRRHRIPLVCFDVLSNAEVVQQVLIPYCNDCHVHVVVTDWDPSPSFTADMGLLTRSIQCPVVCVDSNFWTLRLEAITPNTVQESVEEIMRGGTSVVMKSPELRVMDTAVQRGIECEDGSIFLPESVSPLPVDFPQQQVWVDHVQEALDCWIRFSKTCDPDPRVEKMLEFRDNQGTPSLLRYIDSGELAAARCVRLATEASLSSSRRRVVSEVLLWKREKCIVWALQHPTAQQQQQRRNVILDAHKQHGSDTNYAGGVAAPSADLSVGTLFSAIHQRLVRCGQVHPLLLRHYVAGLKEPRLETAMLAFQQWGSSGCTFAIYCQLWYLLEVEDQGPPLSERHQQALIMCLQ